MKFWKYTFIASVAFFCIATSILYTSCTKDGCESLQCKNGGTCADGFCSCPSGWDGAECENKVTARYIGTYWGYVLPNDGQPHKADTVDVYVHEEPLTLAVTRRSDKSTSYYGTLVGNTVEVPDYISGNYKRSVAISIIDEQLSLSVLEYNAGYKTSDLRFHGTKMTN